MYASIAKVGRIFLALASVWQASTPMFNLISHLTKASRPMIGGAGAGAVHAHTLGMIYYFTPFPLP
jgi:hypothetical protein